TAKAKTNGRCLFIYGFHVGKHKKDDEPKGERRNARCMEGGTLCISPDLIRTAGIMHTWIRGYALCNIIFKHIFINAKDNSHSHPEHQAYQHKAQPHFYRLNLFDHHAPRL